MSVQGLAAVCHVLDLSCPNQRDLESLFTKDKEDLLPFLDWLCSGAVGPENRLSSFELSRLVSVGEEREREGEKKDYYFFTLNFPFMYACSFKKIQAEGLVFDNEQLKVELEQARRRDALGNNDLR